MLKLQLNYKFLAHLILEFTHVKAERPLKAKWCLE